MHRSIVIAGLVGIMCAAGAQAAVKACNAARVSAGDCTNAATQTIILYAFATADLVDLAEDLAELHGWPTLVCTAADVAASPARCAANQIGQVVATPETKTQFGNRKLGEELRQRIFNRRKRLAATAAANATSQPVPIE